MYNATTFTYVTFMVLVYLSLLNRIFSSSEAGDGWCTVKELLGFVAQWIERLSPEQKVVGSIPIKPTSGAFGICRKPFFHARSGFPEFSLRASTNTPWNAVVLGFKNA